MPHDIKWADCIPNKNTDDLNLAISYFGGGYTPRAAWKKWMKGPFPPPFLIEAPTAGTTTNFSVYFNEFTGGTCGPLDCNLQCTNQSIVLVTGNLSGSSTSFCLEGERPIYHFDLEFETEGDRLALPATFQFVFEDNLGNQFTQEVESISGIQPMNPIVGVETDSSGASLAHVVIILRTIGFNEIKEKNLTQFIIERCDWPSRTNIRTFKGPLNNPAFTKLFTDHDISSGQEVAYRIRFKNMWDEESLNSNWIIGGV